MMGHQNSSTTSLQNQISSMGLSLIHLGGHSTHPYSRDRKSSHTPCRRVSPLRIPSLDYFSLSKFNKFPFSKGYSRQPCHTGSLCLTDLDSIIGIFELNLLEGIQGNLLDEVDPGLQGKKQHDPLARATGAGIVVEGLAVTLPFDDEHRPLALALVHRGVDNHQGIALVHRSVDARPDLHLDATVTTISATPVIDTPIDTLKAVKLIDLQGSRSLWQMPVYPILLSHLRFLLLRLSPSTWKRMESMSIRRSRRHPWWPSIAWC